MKSVLCVDDEPSVLWFLQQLLVIRGFDVRAVHDSTRVAEALREKPADLMVLDVEMPEKNGLQLFDELKAMHPTMPILFLTGHPAAFHLDRPDKIQRWQTGFADGLTDILYKPFSSDSLYMKVDALLEQAVQVD